MLTDDEDHAWVPSACTLPTAERPLRVADFDGLFRTAVHRVTRTRPTVLELSIALESEVVARDLAARERRCCSFFRFDFARDAEGLLMRIGVPDDHVDVLDAVQARAVSTSRRGNSE